MSLSRSCLCETTRQSRLKWREVGLIAKSCSQKVEVRSAEVPSACKVRCGAVREARRESEIDDRNYLICLSPLHRRPAALGRRRPWQQRAGPDGIYDDMDDDMDDEWS